MDRDLSGSMEDYLETILLLQKDSPVARAKEISGKLGVKMSSVTNALKQLSEKGYINYDRYSFITLTELGAEYAENILYRHNVLKEFLKCVIAFDDVKSEENACRMEHVMDMDVIRRIDKLVEFMCQGGRSDEFAEFVRKQ
jgi:DtxR family Mn-dependent transcriptional regulator